VISTAAAISARSSAVSSSLAAEGRAVVRRPVHLPEIDALDSEPAQGSVELAAHAGGAMA
jgi:hypothetical protein